MKKNKEPKDPKDQKSIKKQVVRSLPCKLSQKELAEAGQKLAAEMDKIEGIEAQKKVADDGFKKDIGLLEEGVTLLRSMLKSGHQERDVACEEVTDYRAGEVRVTRLDTKETFSRRTLTKDEIQLPLEAQKPGGKLLAMGAGKDRSEVKDVKPGTEEPERKTPQAGDTIEVETRVGWKSGKVLPISGSVLDVDVGDEAPVQAPIESQMWRWPQAGEKEALKATVGEMAAAHEGKKRGKKSKAKEGPPIDPETGEPLAF